ncbi:hypothetical protein WJX81_000242 [Elliptochloris bilobata]|uniref:Protein kinase domain-containing protein n=1 Tax=Elliptochloris bilobata TaxID=381761 RepID=A0AAW1S537_9CHLO
MPASSSHSSRLDIWDVEKARERKPINLGFVQGFDRKYELGRELGKGGFGVVRVVKSRDSGKEYACKSISKHLDVGNLSPAKQAAHLDNIKREVAVLARLRGTLNVVHCKRAYEDDTHVHIVMELCRGGELVRRIGRRHYSERTVASFMRAVCRTLQQCHLRNILHRDIKPGNFMLLSDDDRSPLKAIDFGLAAFFDPAQLPRTDLGLEGTPWYMAPEALSSEVFPASDVWAAGVMAYQLLSGYLPFDDVRNRDRPALSQVWKAVLTEEPQFRGSAWAQVSVDAKNFVRALLDKDPKKRLTAKQALQHPWLAHGTSLERARGRPLDTTVVQRLQRYAQSGVVRRTLFELIAAELLASMLENATPEASAHGGARAPGSPLGPIGPVPPLASPRVPFPTNALPAEALHREREEAAVARRAGPGGGAIEGPRLLGRVSAGVRGESVHGGADALSAGALAGSVHGARSYWRIMRAAAAAAKFRTRSTRDAGSYVRCVGRTPEEREEQRKAARLSLDTSAHSRLRVPPFHLTTLHEDAAAATDGGIANEVVRSADEAEPMQVDGAAGSGTASESEAEPDRGGDLRHKAPGGSGRRAASVTNSLSAAVPGTPGMAAGDAGSEARDAASGSADGASAGASGSVSNGAAAAAPPPSPGQERACRRVSFQPAQAPAATALGGAPGGGGGGGGGGGRTGSGSSAGTARGSPGGSAHAGHAECIRFTQLRQVLRQLSFTREAEAVTEEELARGLAALGYRVEDEEMRQLAKQVGPGGPGGVRKSAFVASQLDWPALQSDFRGQWLAAARRVFEGLEGGAPGSVAAGELVARLAAKLPAAEVDWAMEDALLEAGLKDEEEIDFMGFLRMLSAGSGDSLDQYDPRTACSHALAAMDTSGHGGSRHGGSGHGTPPSARLPTVAEEARK